MAEHGLRSLVADVESHLAVPDFDLVAARGARVRRRRAAAVAAGTAAVVLVVLVAVAWPLTDDRSSEPVHRPHPGVDHDGARTVLADPDAQVDPDVSGVDGHGNQLTLVRVSHPGFAGATGASSEACDATALRWLGTGGRTRAWLAHPRVVQPLADGFVVTGNDPSCRTARGAGTAYLVGHDGRLRTIDWGPGARRVCGRDTGDLRCRWDPARGRVSLVPAAGLPAHAVLLQGADGGPWWARSPDSRRIFWSRDAVHWREHRTSLPVGAITTASAAGRWAVLAGTTTVDVTADGGRTWRRQDLTAALRPIRIGDVDWTITRSGVLLGVTQLVGRGDILFRSTDASWRRFVPTGVHTVSGLVRPVVRHDAVAVPDEAGWVVSTDDGASWRRASTLP